MVGGAPVHTCTCADGWSGNVSDGVTVQPQLAYEGVQDCTVAGACAGSPCVNGTCTDLLVENEARTVVGANGTAQTQTVTGPSFDCACTTGWTGALCDVEPACISSPCPNGQCQDALDGTSPIYSCSCRPGWAGASCEETSSVKVQLILDKEFSSVSYDSAERRFRDAFVREVAALLDVSTSRIIYSSVAEGSVIVTFSILPAASSDAAAPSPGALFTELQELLDPDREGGPAATIAGSAVVAVPSVVGEAEDVGTEAAPPPPPGPRDIGDGWLGALATDDQGGVSAGGFVIIFLGILGFCVVCACCSNICCKKTGFEGWSTDKNACKKCKCTPRCTRQDCRDACHRCKLKFGCAKRPPPPGSLEDAETAVDDEIGDLHQAAGKPAGGGAGTTMASMRAQVRSQMEKGVAEVRSTMDAA